MSEILQKLTSAVVELDEDRVMHVLKSCLKRRIEPLLLLEKVRSGMEEVGQKYEQGEYFISDLIMSGLIFKEVVNQIKLPGNRIYPFNGITVLFATVEGDIHDIGKNITSGILQSNGINVIDLGVDVAPRTIVHELMRSNARIVCLSGLISSSYSSMKKTVEAFQEANLRDYVKIIIGGIVNESVKDYTGADYWARDSIKAVDICHEIYENFQSSRCLK